MAIAGCSSSDDSSGGSNDAAGQVGGILSPIVLAYLVDRYHDWSLPLHVLSGLYLMASVAWLFIDPRRRSVAEPAALEIP